MPDPRRGVRDPDPQVRDRNRWDAIGGQVAVGGLSRIGGSGRSGGTNLVVRGRGDGGQVRIEHVTLHAQASQTIASGGAGVVWDRIGAAPTEIRGFATCADTIASTGQVVAIPIDVTGMAEVNLWLTWASYADGGDVTIVRTRNGVETVHTFDPGPFTSRFFTDTVVGVEVRAGDTLTVKIPNDGAAGATFSDATVGYSAASTGYSSGAAVLSSGQIDVAIWELAPTTTPPGGLLETMEVESYLTPTATSDTVLEDGVAYTLEVVGNYTSRSDDAETTQAGAPDRIMFPSPSNPLNFANHDADTMYAGKTVDGPYPYHFGWLQFDIGDGSGFQHLEPVDGQFSSPRSNHTYGYRVTGQGAVLKARIADPGATDNSGILKVYIYREG